MAITTYTELKTAVASWLHRSDLTSVIPDFITLCEADFNRRLRIRAMENSTTGTTSTSETLPAGFVGVKQFIITSGGSSFDLEYAPPETINTLGTTQRPYAYSFIGDSIVFGPSPDGAYDYTLTYYKALDSLSVSTASNWMLANAPDVYLFGALAKAGAYIQKDTGFMERYEQALAAVQSADKKDRYGTALTMRRS